MQDAAAETALKGRIGRAMAQRHPALGFRILQLVPGQRGAQGREGRRPIRHGHRYILTIAYPRALIFQGIYRGMVNSRHLSLYI
jgi:hypothetical protein